MSLIPSDLAGSVLQTPLAQRHLSAVRDAERAQSVTAQRQQVAAVVEKDSAVETADNDTQVHTDSEGQGSQGRAFTEPEDNPEPNPQPPDSDEGRLIDLEA
jgi:hypothetical protein